MRLILILLMAFSLAAAPQAKKKGSDPTKPTVALIDLNSASAETLKTLPGMIESYPMVIVLVKPKDSAASVRNVET